MHDDEKVKTAIEAGVIVVIIFTLIVAVSSLILYCQT